MSDPSEPNQRFPTTHWTLIHSAGSEAEDAREALNQLLHRYWPALRAHLVIRKRIAPDDADDLVQGFIQNKVLERDLLQAADADRGRFRTLLATALDNYVANEFRKRMAQKRTADRAVSLESDGLEGRAVQRDNPQQALDIAWTRQLLAEAIERMQRECNEGERSDLWAVFDGRFLKPIFENAPPTSYDELIARFGFRSPAQASNALITAKRMFARQLRTVVLEYVGSETEVDAEIADLMRIVAGDRK